MIIETKKHIARIDILRGIAIICVFVYHSQLYLFPGFETAEPTSAKIILLNLVPMASGWTGVQLFLIISGFLIHLGFLSRKQPLNIVTFYSKRFWRIYPPYLLALIVFCVTGAGIYYYLNDYYGIRHLLTHLLLVHNLSDTYIFSINPSFWSLALEMQLYLIYPMFLFMRKKLGVEKTVLIIFLLVPINSFLSRIVYPDFKYIALISVVGYWWFNWCAGALLAECYLNNKRLFGRYNLLIALMGFMAISLSQYFISAELAGQVAVFAWVAFFEWMLYTRINIDNRLYKIIAIVGVVSYSIYLIHQPFLLVMLSWFDVLGHHFFWAPLKTILIFILVFIVAYFTYKYIEQPSIKLGYRLRKTKQ